MHLPIVKALAVALQFGAPAPCSPVACSGVYHPVLAPIHAAVNIPVSILNGIDESFSGLTETLLPASHSHTHR